MSSRPPIKNRWFHILLALSSEEKHGLQIARDVEDLSAGAVRLWPATLYGSLDELEELGLVQDLAESGEHPEGESRRRRFYRLTQAGADVLAAEAERLSALASTARRNLRASNRSRS